MQQFAEIISINGKKFKTAKFASSLRKALLSEHLGINKHDVRLNDPISDELHKLIWETARNNTDLYRQIFMCYPDDYYTKFSMIPNKNSMQNKAQEYSLKKNYEEKKNQIIGHIVEFPLHFLFIACFFSLIITANSESLVPSIERSLIFALPIKTLVSSTIINLL